MSPNAPTAQPDPTDTPNPHAPTAAIRIPESHKPWNDGLVKGADTSPTLSCKGTFVSRPEAPAARHGDETLASGATTECGVARTTVSLPIGSKTSPRRAATRLTVVRREIFLSGTAVAVSQASVNYWSPCAGGAPLARRAEHSS
ncbi:hypothetical protein GCM10025783_30600 [Amnibacterium soli]|uniref:Uncharacterized protein n=1 Tax=Amnibacterium soli TaxID=1282736 RepID=A0ABP8ZGQ9_9MICO